MIYNLLVSDMFPPGVLGGVLAEVLNVDPATVDTADADGCLEGRDWEALVLCDYAIVHGDLAALLEIQLGEQFRKAPATAELAAALSQRLNTILLWHAEEVIPSAYWLVTPDGLVARARVEQADGPDIDYTVSVVEASVPRFPLARVDLLPEIFREEKIATPTTDAFVAVVDPERVARAEDPSNKAREWLLLWERLVRRMASDWAPTGRYPLESYVQDLQTRDHLDVRLTTAPAELREPLARAVEVLDAVFLAHTVGDGGDLLGRLAMSGSAVADCGWWWHRRPVRLPWVRPGETGRP
ncbi:hypothetical protein ACIBJC_12375 [Streptomyces sp. NPDC050509]|uniref:hypothetical protein n=1 Tax=Streptomyces sp. NPDC050509 TaxID=3365620 RepID=UPI00379738F0